PSQLRETRAPATVPVKLVGLPGAESAELAVDSRRRRLESGLGQSDPCQATAAATQCQGTASDTPGPPRARLSAGAAKEPGVVGFAGDRVLSQLASQAPLASNTPTPRSFR